MIMDLFEAAGATELRTVALGPGAMVLRGFAAAGEALLAALRDVTARAPFRHRAGENPTDEVAVGSKGLGDRRQRVQPEQVLAQEIWLLPISWQNRIAEIQEKIN